MQEVTEMVDVMIIIAIVALCAFSLYRVGSPYADKTSSRHA